MDETVKSNSQNNNKRKKIALVVFSIVFIVGSITIYLYLDYKSKRITTDDAFIEGRIHMVASKINGTVKAVYVRDNQSVKKGDLLMEIDPIDYEIKVREALSGLEAEQAKLSEIEARIEVSKRQLSEIVAAIETAKANLALQEATLNQAEREFKRAEELYREEIIPKERYERAETSYRVAIAQVRAAKEQLRKAEMNLQSQQAIVIQAEAAKKTQYSATRQKEALLKEAELNRSYTRIYSPSDGYITKKSVEIGNQIRAGQPLMAVVPLNDIWIVANYKETQLEKVRPGQRVRIKVDAYPGKVFWGKVDSLMAGTGAVFSLFPPENATGNYVKVVQRIPVKIVLDGDTDPQHLLRIGMSVVPTVIVK